MNDNHILYLFLASNNIVGIVIAIRFFNSIFTKKDILKFHKIASLTLIGVVAIVMNVLIEEVSILLIIYFAVYFLIAKLYYNGKSSIKAISSVFIVIFSILTELLTAILLSYVFSSAIDEVRNNLLHLLAGGLVSKLMLIILFEAIIRFKSRKVLPISVASWIFIISIPAMSIHLSIITVYNPILNHEVGMGPFITCMLVLYINLVAFYLFDNIIFQIAENNEYRFKERQMLMQHEQYENVISGYDQVKRIKHDIQNHLVSLNAYLRENEYQTAMDYVKKLNRELDLSEGNIISNNVVVDALINNCRIKAKQTDIEFKYDILIPDKFQIDDMDLCIALGNVLTNAIEGCARIETHLIDKVIHLSMKYKNETLLVELNNTCDLKTIGKNNNRYLSSKRYKDNNTFGTGIGNVEVIVGKYGGFLKIDIEESIFTLKMMLSDRCGEIR